MTMPLLFASTAKASRRSSLDPAKKFALLVLSGIVFAKVIDIEIETVPIGRNSYEVLFDTAEIS
jgi:hypothetical protein